eukprot:2559655-Lingulodinium_polyedra.AAC.1
MMSKCLVFLDAAFMMEMQRQHEELLNAPSDRVGAGGAIIYLAIDSSPQAGHDWLMVEETVFPCRDLRQIARGVRELSASRQGLAASLDEEELENLNKGIKVSLNHVFPPMALGSRHAGLEDKLVACLFAVHLETNTNALAQKWADAVGCITSDFGTEVGLAQAPAI